MFRWPVKLAFFAAASAIGISAWAQFRTDVRLVATAVRRIMTLVGIDQLMPVYPSVAAALADPSSHPRKGQ